MAKLAAAVFIIAALAAGGAIAAEAPKTRNPEQMIREGAERILDGVRQFIERIPQYAPPEFLPNGDIILRKLPRGSGHTWPQSGPEPGPDGSLKT
jgi:hypothetical protein